jgi:hypothetical protein
MDSKTESPSIQNSEKGFKSYLLGKMPTKTYFLSLIGNLLFLLIAITISILLYEGNFDLREKEISAIDNINRNPKGLWAFEIGFIVGGIWFIPIALHVLRKMALHNKFVGYFLGFLYVMSGLGMVVVALNPTRVSKPMHLVGAVMGFGCLIFATLICLIFLIVKLVKNYNRKILSIGVLFFLPFVVVVVLTFFYSGLPLLESFERGIPFGGFTPEVWEIFEWGMLFSGFWTTFGLLKLLESDI